MKYSSLIIAALVSLVLVGCRGPNDPETHTINQYNATHPNLVMRGTPKGDLYMIIYDFSSDSHGKHYIYYFENSTNTVTINSIERAGKTSYTKVIVVDGVEYTEVKK